MIERLLGQFDEVMFTQYLDNPRAVPPEELQTIAHQLSGRQYPVFRDPAAAWDAVRRLAGPDGPRLRHRVVLHCGRDAASACRAAVCRGVTVHKGSVPLGNPAAATVLPLEHRPSAHG